MKTHSKQPFLLFLYYSLIDLIRVKSPASIGTQWQHLFPRGSEDRHMSPESGQAGMPFPATSSNYQMDETERKIRRIYTMVEVILVLQVFFLILLFVP